MVSASRPFSHVILCRRDLKVKISLPYPDHPDYANMPNPSNHSNNPNNANQTNRPRQDKLSRRRSHTCHPDRLPERVSISRSSISKVSQHAKRALLLGDLRAHDVPTNARESRARRTFLEISIQGISLALTPLIRFVCRPPKRQHQNLEARRSALERPYPTFLLHKPTYTRFSASQGAPRGAIIPQPSLSLEASGIPSTHL
jgi:hypothetical protein